VLLRLLPRLLSAAPGLTLQVSMFSRAKAAGLGHSWWSEQFCAGNTSTALNIVMTELDTTREM
jgi:hypothetical protein